MSWIKLSSRYLVSGARSRKHISILFLHDTGQPLSISIIASPLPFNQERTVIGDMENFRCRFLYIVVAFH